MCIRAWRSFVVVAGMIMLVAETNPTGVRAQALPEIPSECTVLASPPSSPATPVLAGTNVRLTASCAKGTAPITYVWHIGVVGIAVLSVAPSSTTTYVLTASNIAGAGALFQITVHIGTPAPPIPLPASGPNSIALIIGLLALVGAIALRRPSPSPARTSRRLHRPIRAQGLPGWRRRSR